MNLLRKFTTKQPITGYNRNPAPKPARAAVSADILAAIEEVVQQRFVDPTVQALSMKEFCETWGIGRDLAYREIRAGRLTAVKVGRRTLIRRSDAERWIAGATAIGA